MRRALNIIFVVLVIIAVPTAYYAGTHGWQFPAGRWPSLNAIQSTLRGGRGRVTRPYGMAPVAFEAFVRACTNAGVSPNRITQTIGDYPMSVGYHQQDGVLKIDGELIPYSAATDIHVIGLTPRQILRLSRHLAWQGFACWYRRGGKWEGNEHIHAVYAFLPMKRQLQLQVVQFLQERREAGWKRLKWERKLRCHPQFRSYFALLETKSFVG